MPDNKIDLETDGNPETVYEDTTAHERTAFFVNETEEAQANPEQPSKPLD